MQKRFNVDSASPEEIANKVTKFMVNNKNRHSATRSEIARLFDCSINKATRILNSMVSAGKIKRDFQAENTYWLNVDTF